MEDTQSYLSLQSSLPLVSEREVNLEARRRGWALKRQREGKVEHGVSLNV